MWKALAYKGRVHSFHVMVFCLCKQLDTVLEGTAFHSAVGIDGSELKFHVCAEGL